MNFRTPVFVLGAASVLIGAPARSADTLSLVHPFSPALIYTKSCIELVGDINRLAGGGLEITVRGGPEAIRTVRQPQAVRKGTADMSCVPASFYAASLPENEAISTSNASPAHVRANGGMAIIDRLHQRYYGSKYLGWIDSGIRYHVYLTKSPIFRRDGSPDFDRVKLRDHPIYGAFLRALGATTHNMNFSAVTPALAKGALNAGVWTALGLKHLKWHRYLRHRINPGFYQTDIGLILNLARWKKLDKKSRTVLQAVVIAHEGKSRKARQAESRAESKLLARGGMKSWNLEGKAAAQYLKAALDSAYSRMEGRLKKRKRPIESARKLRTLYQM